MTEAIAQGGMMTALAHEIKNPAALALAHIQLLGTENIHLTHIRRALEDIVDLTQEMLSVSYGTPLAFDFDLREILAEITEAYQAAWPGIRFLLSPCETAALTIRAPESRVRMVFSNLLKNAVEADANTIRIYCGAKDGNVFVVIRDDGTGYDEALPHKKKPHGNGLGLPIARWLLEQMGGDLTLRTGAQGGCEAVVRLR